MKDSGICMAHRVLSSQVGFFLKLVPRLSLQLANFLLGGGRERMGTKDSCVIYQGLISKICVTKLLILIL